VQRQYTGTAGRIENAQVAIYLTDATDAGHAFIDRALYLPKSGIPDDTTFATKPALATTMIGRALDAGVQAGWPPATRSTAPTPACAKFEQRGIGYVPAIGRDRRVSTTAGALRADGIATRLPKHVWQRLSAGAVAKGHRYYDWAFADIDIDEPGGHRWLLIRRNRTTGELAFYRCCSPANAPGTRASPVYWSARRAAAPSPRRCWSASVALEPVLAWSGWLHWSWSAQASSRLL
jgi:hypothetical protein